MDLTGTTVPTWVMALAAAALTLCLLIGLPLAGMAGRRRGRRLANPAAFTGAVEKAKDTALFLAALLPSLLVWLAVMGVSFIGLTGFARTVLQWDHWTNLLVPLSLDGISISFGAWAFVAVKRGRHPGRAYKIVLSAAAMSAVLNFVHGRTTWSLWAGLYLAFLSFAGMAMFHELLDQFMASYDEETGLKTRYPRFGQRWLYAPFSTFAARRAWIVDPPRNDLRPSVRNALSHAQAVKEAKRQRRLGGAYLVQEEQQAKLVEVMARNEVRAAKRGEALPPVDSLADVFSSLPPAPISPAVSLSPPAAPPPGTSPAVHMRPPGKAPKGRGKHSETVAPVEPDGLVEEPAPPAQKPRQPRVPREGEHESLIAAAQERTGSVAGPHNLAPPAAPDAVPGERNGRKRASRAEAEVLAAPDELAAPEERNGRKRASQVEAEVLAAAEDVVAESAVAEEERAAQEREVRRKRGSRAEPASVEDADPGTGRAQVEVPWGAAFMGQTFPVPGVMPTLQTRVWEILDAQVGRKDDLRADHVTEAVLRTLAVPANRETVASHIAAWADEVQLGVRPRPKGPGVSVAEPDAAAAKAGYPFEVLALRPITVGRNVVACPSCDTTAALAFSGMHPRRPVEATCGCGQRWAITGLGSTRVLDVLAVELAAGHARVIDPQPLV